MTKSILLIGVGGQGTILISRILSAGFVRLFPRSASLYHTGGEGVKAGAGIAALFRNSLSPA